MQLSPAAARRSRLLILKHRTKVPQNLEASVRKVTAADLAIGLICADRDGNRVRIDSVDHGAAKLSYHFLNDELRVQEGIQEPSIQQFLSEGWYVSASRGAL